MPIEKELSRSLSKSSINDFLCLEIVGCLPLEISSFQLLLKVNKRRFQVLINHDIIEIVLQRISGYSFAAISLTLTYESVAIKVL